MNLPIFELRIKEDDESGVEAVALVDKPAIELDYQAFNKSNQIKFTTQNAEKRIISGPLMVADMPIYRRDNNIGEYYVVFRADTIEKIVQKFFKNKLNNSVNVMHNSSAMPDGVYMFESFIIDSKRGINTPSGYDTLADGSWFGSFKVDNESLWQEYIKTGMLKGFSVEGMFEQVKVEQSAEEKLLNAMNDFLTQLYTINK